MDDASERSFAAPNTCGTFPFPPLLPDALDDLPALPDPREGLPAVPDGLSLESFFSSFDAFSFLPSESSFFSRLKKVPSERSTSYVFVAVMPSASVFRVGSPPRFPRKAVSSTVLMLFPSSTSFMALLAKTASSRWLTPSISSFAFCGSRNCTELSSLFIKASLPSSSMLPGIEMVLILLFLKAASPTCPRYLLSTSFSKALFSKAFF